MATALQVLEQESQQGIETTDYIKRLLHMSDQLRIAEQKVSISIEREVERLYKQQQYAVNTGIISLNALNKEKA